MSPELKTQETDAPNVISNNEINLSSQELAFQQEELQTANQWIEFKVKVKLIADLVQSHTSEINLAKCTEVVNTEITKLRLEDKNNSEYIQHKISVAQHRHEPAASIDDYTVRDIDNLHARYEFSVTREKLLGELQGDEDILVAYTESIISSVLPRAYAEAFRIVKERARIAAEKAEELEKAVNQLKGEIAQRDIKIWDTELEAAAEKAEELEKAVNQLKGEIQRDIPTLETELESIYS